MAVIRPTIPHPRTTTSSPFAKTLSTKSALSLAVEGANDTPAPP